MFTGIVETMGEILKIHGDEQGVELLFKPQILFSDVKLGDSIAVNGVCLTVTAIEEQCFSTQAVPETLRKTNLGNLKEKDAVNLERSMLATTRIGGHFVQGHVDGVANIIKIGQEGDAQLVTFEIPEHLTHYVINKGFITIDGMSITVINIQGNQVLVTFIPHTQQATVVQYYKVGTLMNIEIDMMARYVEKLIEARQ